MKSHSQDDLKIFTEFILFLNLFLKVHPGYFSQNDFRYSPEPIMREAWKDRIEPHLPEMKQYG